MKVFGLRSFCLRLLLPAALLACCLQLRAAEQPGNRSPYQVFGETYKVLPSNDNYIEVGIASWYGRKFHGRKTANGEIFNMYKRSAAHKSLRLPCWVRVTNLDNQRRIVVRVNDRGPFHDDRLIDLSYAAARALGFAEKGTTTVVVEIMLRSRAGADLPASHERRPTLPARLSGLVPHEYLVTTLTGATEAARAWQAADLAELFRLPDPGALMRIEIE